MITPQADDVFDLVYIVCLLGTVGMTLCWGAAYSSSNPARLPVHLVQGYRVGLVVLGMAIGLVLGLVALVRWGFGEVWQAMVAACSVGWFGWTVSLLFVGLLAAPLLGLLMLRHVARYPAVTYR